MAEIKIYEHFREQVVKMGKVRRAWFTTFNLDIAFFERYVLAALTGRDPSMITRSIDFEAMNQDLLAEGETDDDKIEVKVFYDYRALRIAGKPKQTIFTLHPIDCSELKDVTGKKHFNGVFHPKVVLLENDKKQLWLMASSANLTFGGWARNRETAFSSNIQHTGNAREVHQFFNEIARVAKIRNSPLLDHLERGRFGGNYEGWRFIHSISGERFIEQLADESKINIRIWSPYFSNQLPAIIEKHLLEHFDSIDIIPSKNEIRKIRITADILAACKQIKGVNFQQDKTKNTAENVFVHAKVWLTPTSISVGSWNMTESGMNITRNGSDNIEAGITMDMTSRMYSKIVEEYVTVPLKNPEHLTEEEMKAEKEDILNDFSLSVELLVNWKELQIVLVRPTFNSLISSLPQGSEAKLPGGLTCNIRTLKTGISFRHIEQSILYDRLFEIVAPDGKTLYRGFLTESNIEYRPVYSFSSLDDFMKGWINENPENINELHISRLPADGPNGDELSENVRQILLSDDANPWFASFQALSGIRNRIKNASLLHQKARKNELIKIGRSLPGSLSELRKHLDNLLDIYKTDPAAIKKSPVYLWYMVEQANLVFKKYNQYTEEREEKIKLLKNFDLLSLKPDGDSNKEWSVWLTKLTKKYLNSYAD